MSESKQKKITVNFFLNKNVQPDSIVDGKTGKSRKAYPLYLSVTFNRKNMQFKSNYGMIYSVMEDVPTKLMEFEEKLITKVIMIERLMAGDGEYSMKGISTRYPAYATSLSSVLEEYLKPKLILAIRGTNNELMNALDLKKEIGKNTVLLLYKAAGLLFENFQKKLKAELKLEIETYEALSPRFRSAQYDFPTVIDWADGSYQLEFLDGLTESKQKPEFIQRAMNLIDSAVRN